MSVTLSQTEDQAFVALRAFLISILPPNTPVIQARANRVPEPRQTDFVLMTPLFRERLSTNIDTAAEAAFVASIAGPKMTVTSVSRGTIIIGALVNGTSVVPGTTVLNLGLGTTDGIGTYTVAPPQTLASGPLWSGTKAVLDPIRLTVQIDVHGPTGADNIQRIAALWRDDFACLAFQRSGIDAQPLYADEPMQVPFVNGEAQYETRWTMNLLMQINPVVTVQQQFAGEVTVALDPVDALIPVS